jgi:O-antigen/teichoic acid export membrane protein/serine acetyltransferase
MTKGPLVAKNAAFLFASQLITWSLSALMWVIVPRSVGPSEWGEYTLACAIIGVASAIVGLGISVLLVKEIAREPERAGDFIGAGLIARLLTSLPFLALIWGTAFVAHYSAHNYSAHTRVILAILTVWGLIVFVAGPLGAGVNAFQKMHITGLGEIINNALVALGAVILVLALHSGMISIAIVCVVGQLFVAGLDLWALSKVTPIRLHVSAGLVRHIIVGGVPYWISGLVLTFYIWVDSVILSLLTTTTVVGWYGVASRVFAALLFVPTILCTALAPALAHSFRHDPEQHRALMRRGFRLIVSLGLPIATGVALLAPAIVHLLFGAAYASAGRILLVLGISIVPTYINVTAGTYLISMDRQVAWTRVMGVACLVNPLVNLLTIPLFQQHFADGGLGAAVALLLTEIMMAMGGLWLLPRHMLDREALRPLFRSAVAAALMGLVVWPLRAHFIGLPIAMGATVYLVAAVGLRAFPREDLALVTPLLTRVTGRLGRAFASTGAGAQPSALQLITEDVRVWKRIGYLGPTDGSDLTFRDAARLIWQHSGLRATINYRLSAEAKRLGIPALPGILARRNVRRYGLDIVPSVPIGPGLYIPHPVGTVIMAQSIGSRCQLISGITIGMRGHLQFATIGDDVYIGAGARVLGDIHIGDGAHIGANAVVLKDVPAGVTAVGVPARLLPPRHTLAREPEGAAVVTLPNGTTNGHNGQHAAANVVAAQYVGWDAMPETTFLMPHEAP